MSSAATIRDMAKNAFEAMLISSLNCTGILADRSHSIITYSFIDGSRLIVIDSRTVEVQESA